MNSSQSLESRFLHLHQAIYEATGGAIGHRLIGVPTLLLTTTGQRTGKRRTTALVYAKDADGSLIVTASNGGADRAPGWYHNVKTNAAVEVQIGRRRFTGEAEVIGAGEYPRLWTLVNRNARGRYERYQGQTDRVIELVRLRVR
jgi:F420H(2)-dependent quinone reductase